MSSSKFFEIMTMSYSQQGVPINVASKATNAWLIKILMENEIQREPQYSSRFHNCHILWAQLMFERTSTILMNKCSEDFSAYQKQCALKCPKEPENSAYAQYVCKLEYDNLIKELNEKSRNLEKRISRESRANVEKHCGGIGFWGPTFVQERLARDNSSCAKAIIDFWYDVVPMATHPMTPNTIPMMNFRINEMKKQLVASNDD